MTPEQVISAPGRIGATAGPVCREPRAAHSRLNLRRSAGPASALTLRPCTPQMQQMMAQMGNITPDMMAQAQAQMNSMRPEDWDRAKQQMSGMSSDDLVRQASQATSQFSAQQQYTVSVRSPSCS